VAETFGRFRLEECLGRGGMGEVYRAYDPQQRRLVAVKRLWTRGFDEDERSLLAKRLAQEADAMSGLAIPNVLPVFESGRIDGQPYIVMPYVRGRDLAQVIQDGPLAPRRAVAVLGQLATALDFTHAAGLVHRDVKPSNVLLVEHPGGRDAVYLLDYGIARAVSGATRTRLTSGIIGTFAYIAPERLDGEETSTDGRVDVYAAACVFFECLTGQQPYPGLQAHA
jgi:serine/threonine protein kinase